MMQAVLIGTDAVLARLANVGPNVSKEMKRAVERLTTQLQRRVVTGYLSGQALHVRTGTLRRSINRRLFDDGKGGWVGTVGTNTPYARVHEYGGVYNIPSHMAQHRSSKSLNALKRRGGSVAWSVKAHTARYLERAFMRPSLRDLSGEIRNELAAALARAAQSAMKDNK